MVNLLQFVVRRSLILFICCEISHLVQSNRKMAGKSSHGSKTMADLHKHFLSCVKNPAHKPFIPVKQFTMKHLPQRYHDNDILELIKAMIYLTVRVCGGYTSFDRPETSPTTGQSYPFYRLHSKKFTKTGTGMVYGVVHYTDEYKKRTDMEGKTCPCEPCKHSPTPMTLWCEVGVQTAQHLVFDTAEAKHTTCLLFYDSEEEQNNIVELKGDHMGALHINQDWCRMICVTHDMGLGLQLQQMCRRFDNLCHKLWKEYSEPTPEHPLTVIVAHPHGCGKHVTIGECTDTEIEENIWSRHTYTTQTCPGSGGAAVFILGISRLISSLHVHSKVRGGFNMSGSFLN